jgi:hypothetical protein
VLVEHRVDDVDERLVAVEQAVTARQHVALEPPLAEMLGQDLHHPTVGRQMIVTRNALGVPRAIGHLKQRGQPVGRGLVGAHDPEAIAIGADDVAKPRPQHPGRLARCPCRVAHVYGVVTEVGQFERAGQ